MRIPTSLIVLLGFVFSAGCQTISVETGKPSEASATPAAAPLSTSLPVSPTQGDDMPDRSDRTPTKLPERIPPTEVIPPITGEVPTRILDLILKDLAARTGVVAGEIAVVQAQAIVWNDGSLGCPRPGEFYTQALVNGYWVILKVGEQEYDYRAADTGYFFLCEGGFRPLPPSGTPGS